VWKKSDPSRTLSNVIGLTLHESQAFRDLAWQFTIDEGSAEKIIPHVQTVSRET
jgi:hypothetical protein